MSSSDCSRRGLFRVVAIGAGFILLGDIQVAFGKDVPLPKGKKAVSEFDDPMAQSLGYTPNAKDVNKAKFPNYQPNQACKTCGFFTKVNDGWGQCTLFQSGLVNAKGWCSSWNLKK